MSASNTAKILLELYKLSQESMWFSPKDFAKRVGWKEGRAVRLFQYLTNKGYLERVMHGVYVETTLLRQTIEKLLRAVEKKKEEIEHEKQDKVVSTKEA